MNYELKYESAIQRLEAIVKKIENNELGIDEIAANLKEAQQLIKFCKEKLTKTEKELSAIREVSE